MKKILIYSVLIGSLSSFSMENKPDAYAELINRDGEKVGYVYIYKAGDGVLMKIDVKLPPGIHAFHIHEQGKCEPPSFKSARGHFNPYGKEHGFLNPRGHHAGDLPNIYVPKSGELKLEIYTPFVSLDYWKENYLLKKGGTAIVIHEGPDDYKSNPAGKAGKRIACGVIKPYKR